MTEQAPAYREEFPEDVLTPPGTESRSTDATPAPTGLASTGLPEVPLLALIDSFADYETARLQEPHVFEADYDDVEDKDCLHSMVKHFGDDPAVMIRVDRDFVHEKHKDRPKLVLSDSLLQDFKDRANRYRLLTADEEVVLARNMKLGVMAHKEMLEQERLDDQVLLGLAREGAYSYQAFFHANLRLVWNIAGSYRSAYQHIEESDGLIFGYTGLQRAIEKFDETKGYRFSTYATNWIKQNIRRGVADEGRIVRLPVNKDAELKRYKKKKEQLSNQQGREPTREEICAATGLDEEDVKVFEVFGDYSTASLNKAIDDEGRELADIIICEDPSERSVEALEVSEELGRLINYAELTHLEKLILSLESGIKLSELEGSTWQGVPYEDIFDRVTPPGDKKQASVAPRTLAKAICVPTNEVVRCQEALNEKLQRAVTGFSDS